MRLGYSKSKNTTQFYVIKDTNKKGVRSTKIVKKLGNSEQIKKKYNCDDPFVWAKNYVEELNKKIEKNQQEVIAKFSENKIIQKNKQSIYNCGYLFLKKIYNDLNISSICKNISKKYKFEYDLNQILENLIYTRILFPSSKQSSYETSKKFLVKPNHELHDIYRALEVISKETDYIQSQLYKNSLNVINRNSNILYYDCTNYFFEIEQANGLKQYGVSKEHRPNPIVQMGLFMDGNGIPLAFNITEGNKNEQLTLKPLEMQIVKDFELSEFVVCTDAGLSSTDNRKFNSIGNRNYIVTQSLKKLPKHLQDWAFENSNWKNINGKKVDLSTIDNSSSNNEIYYKERWINENGLEQRLIVSYSPKYAEYQRNIRNNQIERAKAYIEKGSTISHKKNTDAKRFIKSTPITNDGEIAENKEISLNTDLIEREEKFDGFYAVCTRLENDISEIIKANKQRWEIEESFRIMKTEFKTRPVYLSRDDRIKAHFTTCFISLMIYRILEKKLNEKYSCDEIIKTLKEMNLLKIDEDGYTPCYTRTDLTDDLHKLVNFKVDRQYINKNKINKKIRIF